MDAIYTWERKMSAQHPIPISRIAASSKSVIVNLLIPGASLRTTPAER